MKKLVILFVLFINFKHYSQISLLKKDSIAISNYIKAQNLQKKNPEILVIEDKKWVELIRNYTNSKQKSNDDLFLKKLKNKSIGERFSENDKTVDSEIIAIINQGNIDSINKLYNELGFYFPIDFKAKEINPQLKKLFFQSINNPKLESSVAMMMSNLLIVGFEKVIEDKLLSGQSNDEFLLFYCLSKGVVSNGAVDYFINSVLNTGKYRDKDIFKRSLVQSLQYMSRTSNVDNGIKSKISDFCVQLLNKYTITSQILDEHSNIRQQNNREPFLNGTEFEDQLGVLYVLIENNDSRVIPFLKLLKELGVKDNIQFDFLFWKFGQDKSETTFNKLLSDFQYYYSVVYELDQKGILLNDDNLMNKVLSNFEKTPTFEGMKQQVFMGWDISKIRHLMTIFYKLEKPKLISILNKSIQSEENRNIFIKEYERNNRSSVISYISYQKKLFNNTSNGYNSFESGVYLNNHKLDICNSFMNDMYKVNYKIFDVRTVENEDDFDGPSDTRAFLKVIKNHSNDELKNITYFFDNKRINEDEKFEFNCYVLSNDIVYFMKINEKTFTQNLIINQLSKKLLSVIGSQNRFVELDFWMWNSPTTYTFGNPEIVNGILNKYDFKN